jgi:hypothetical protein
VESAGVASRSRKGIEFVPRFSEKTIGEERRLGSGETVPKWVKWFLVINGIAAVFVVLALLYVII